MKRRMHIVAMAVGLAVMWGAAEAALASSLPQEPSDDYLVNEEVDNGVGFYFREYSLAQDGTIDYRTARQILTSESGDLQGSVVQAKEFPLFYWYDDDHDGRFEMWVDRNVEGCSCDIVRYRLTSSRQ